MTKDKTADGDRIANDDKREAASLERATPGLDPPPETAREAAEAFTDDGPSLDSD